MKLKKMSEIISKSVHCNWGLSDELCKRVSIQRRHAPFKDDGKSLHRLTPILDRHRPLIRDVTQGSIEQFERRLIIRKRSPRLDHFPQAHVQRLYRVGRIDSPANIFREAEHRNHSGPVGLP